MRYCLIQAVTFFSKPSNLQKNRDLTTNEGNYISQFVFRKA